MEGADRPGEVAARSARDQQADARESAADDRERDSDIREGILDRWERQLTAQAESLNMFDDERRKSFDAARRSRSLDRIRRRAEAEARHDEAVERGINRATHTDPPPESRPTPPTDTQVRAIDRLATLIGGGATLVDILFEVMPYALDAFTEAVAATATVLADGQLQPGGSTTAWAATLDIAQLRAQAGPAVESVATGTVVLSADLAADDRWQLSGVVGTGGHRGVLSAPVVVNGEPAGAITVYTDVGGRFEGQPEVVAQLLAAHVSLALAWNVERITHHAQMEAFERALASRDQIGQAKGILMEQRSLTAEQALVVLRETSQHLNTKVRDIAETVVTTRQLPQGPSAATPSRPSTRP